MRKPARKESSLPSARPGARGTFAVAEPEGTEAPRGRTASARPKRVSIAVAERILSPHVVDLTQFSPTRPQEDRADLDLTQRLGILAHAVRSAAPRVDDEHRAFMPLRPDRKAPRASIRGFLKLPFALLALPFRRTKALAPKPVVKAAAPAPVKKAVSPTPAPAAPEPKVIVESFSAPHPVAHLAALAPALPSARPAREPKISVMPRTASKTSAPKAVPAKALAEADEPPTPPRHWMRRVLGFAALAVAVSLPLQALLSYTGLLAKAGLIAAGTKEAAAGLREGGASFGEEGGPEAFGRAAGAFAETRSRVDGISVRLAALLTGNAGTRASGARLLAAGEAASKAGAVLAAGYEQANAAPETVAQKLGRMTDALAAALPHLETASTELERIPLRSLPDSFRAPFDALRGDIGGAVADLQRATASSATLLDAVGANGKRRYLVVFQNSRELRPTGGFIGSYALMDLKDGSIEGIEIPPAGSYDLRGGLNRRIEAPEQLRLVNPRWEFQDANWFADFPISAQALTWFYEKSGGPTVDGVIAVTSDVMEGLLAASGPIEMPEYGKTIDAENFHLETQKSVEIEYDRVTNRPKQIISDMAPKLLKRLLDDGAADMPKLASALGGALASKDIQVWFRDEDAQAAAAGFGWTGELAPPADGDFLAVVDTNIAGGKTDAAVKADIAHESAVQADGSIIDTVTVTRTHTGRPGELFSGLKNIDWMRVYVPKGSELLAADGFEAPGEGYFLPKDGTLQPSSLLAAVEGETRTHASGTRISEESGLTVFGNWVQVEPGASATVTLRYRLPFRLQDLERTPETSMDRLREKLGAWSPTAPLKLVVRKQPGATPRRFTSQLTLPPEWKVEEAVPAPADGSGLTLDAALDRDLFVGRLLVHRD